jgi:hypothetical protein
VKNEEKRRAEAIFGGKSVKIVDIRTFCSEKSPFGAEFPGSFGLPEESGKPSPGKNERMTDPR